MAGQTKNKSGISFVNKSRNCGFADVFSKHSTAVTNQKKRMRDGIELPAIPPPRRGAAVVYDKRRRVRGGRGRGGRGGGAVRKIVRNSL